MEILHAFGIDYRLLIIQMVNFGVLLLVLWRFLYRPLLNLMDSRKAVIEKGVRDAHEAEKKLKAAEVEKQDLLKQAVRDADALAERARKDVAHREREAILEAEAKAARILGEAETLGGEMKRKALEESKQEIAKLVVLGMEKALKK